MIVRAHACVLRELAQQDRADEERDREEQVGEAHQEVVEPAAVVAGDDPDDRADDVETSATMTPTSSEIRPPYSTFAHMSRALSFVPNQCPRLRVQERLQARRSTPDLVVSGWYFVNSGANTHMNAMIEQDERADHRELVPAVAAPRRAASA